MKDQGLSSVSKERTVSGNFSEIEQRLKTAHYEIERVWTPSAEETQQILKARALALAEKPAPGELGDGIEVVEFLLAHEHYAVESCYVREVIYVESLTPLPCTPPFVLGIANVRGEIIPVIDLREFFELPERGLTDLNKIIVLQSGKILFSILVDRIVSVRGILIAHIQPSLPTLTGIRENYLKGITPERLVILDAERLLMDDNIVMQEQIAE